MTPRRPHHPLFPDRHGYCLLAMFLAGLVTVLWDGWPPALAWGLVLALVIDASAQSDPTW